ncbi:MAG: arylsulfatase [Planctomycetaceae bacterium]|jgi:arylsulfatase A|nr:arylsulfatase [Planctomycetaceae bacterium]MDG2389258.1 arylsulfatase [Planctomycetaceae bacterium]
MRISYLSFLLVVLSGTNLILSSAEARQPNIIFIMADDLGYHELGCYGQKWIKTPNIDRIAAEGMKFTQFYSGEAVCAPARCVLLTGKHTGHSYVRNNGDPKHLQHLAPKYGWEFPGQYPIPDEEVTVAELLKEEGYATAACGKWGLGHVGTSGDPNKQGFDLFYGFNCQRHAHNHYPKFLWRNDKKEILPGNDRTLNGETYSQDKFTEVALEFIKENKEKPFFLYLPFAIPHLSIQVTEESLNEYKGKIPEEEYVHKGYLEHPFPRAGYAAMVTHMDRDVGKVMTLVEKLGLDDNTIIFFTSDNGPTYDRLGGSDSDFFASAGQFKGLKGSLYEGGIRVPLVARWPGKIVPGTISHHRSAFWDVMPTLTDIAGADAPVGIDGLSFAPTLLGKPDQQKQHAYLYWEFAAYGGQQAVRIGNWKGIRQNMFKGSLHTELYDLSIDIGESKDVSAQNPEVVKQIEHIMATARVPSETYKFKALDEWQAKVAK